MQGARHKSGRESEASGTSAFKHAYGDEDLSWIYILKAPDDFFPFVLGHDFHDWRIFFCFLYHIVH